MRKAFGLASAGIAAPIRAYLAKGALWAFVLNLAASGLTLLGSMMIAWIGGKEQFGAYSIVFNWVNVLCIPALFGMNDLLMRELPAWHGQDDQGRARSLVRFAFSVGGLATFVVTAVFWSGVRWGGWFGLGPYAGLFDLALIALPMLVFTHLGQAVFLGTQQIARGQATEKLIKPAAFVLLLGGAWAWCSGVGDTLLVGLQVLSFLPGVLSLLWMLGKLYRSWPVSAPGAEPPVERRLLVTGFYFLLAATVQVLFSRVDMLFLGYFFADSPEQVGFYSVAARYAELLLLPFVVLNTISAPLYAKLHAEKNLSEMQSVYARTTRILFVVSLATTAAALLLGPVAMGWFGKDFTAGYKAFCWLAFGQLFYAFTGTGGQVLLMTGHERLALSLQATGLLVAVVGHLILIPRWGIDGAAVAAIAGYFTHCALLFVFVPRRLGIRVGGSWLKGNG
jgi:O-antigen/teichoic acid export membrane protein